MFKQSTLPISVLYSLSLIHLAAFKQWPCTDSSEEVCKGLHDEPPPEIFTMNTKTHIFVAYNSSASQVAVLDYKANISSVYNGLTGAGILFNFETGESVYIAGGSSSETWLSTKTTFKDYFGNLPSQKKIWKYGDRNGVRFDASSITPEISQNIAVVLASLSSDYSSSCNAFSNYLHASKITSDAMKGSLQGFEEVMGDVDTPYRGDFKWLIGAFQGINTLFEKTKGGIDILNTKKISLELGKIFTASTGYHVLIYFLTEISPHFDIGDLFGEALNSSVSFFRIIDKLGGDVEYGFDGFNNLLSEIVTYLHGITSIQNLQIILTDFVGHPKTDKTAVLKQFPSAIKDLLTAIEKLNLTKELSGLTKLLKNILSNEWYENGVNLSAFVIKILSNNSTVGDADSVNQILNLVDSSNTTSLTLKTRF